MDPKERLESLEADKAQMIARYMSLQDQADSVNGEIYKVCCGVEALNVQILALKKEMRKAAMKASAQPPDGKPHPPTNGKAH